MSPVSRMWSSCVRALCFHACALQVFTVTLHQWNIELLPLVRTPAGPKNEEAVISTLMVSPACPVERSVTGVKQAQFSIFLIQLLLSDPFSTVSVSFFHSTCSSKF